MNYEYDAVKIGNILRDKRKKIGYSQDKIAEILGVSVDSISNYENGKCNMTAEVLFKIANQYNMSLSLFLVAYERKINVESTINVLLEKYSERQQIAIYNILDLIYENFTLT